jgi:hypothetical protein
MANCPQESTHRLGSSNACICESHVTTVRQTLCTEKQRNATQAWDAHCASPFMHAEQPCEGISHSVARLALRSLRDARRGGALSRALLQRAQRGLSLLRNARRGGGLPLERVNARSRHPLALFQFGQLQRTSLSIAPLDTSRHVLHIAAQC